MTEQGVRYHIKKELFRADTDIQYYTSTKKAVLGLSEDAAGIWTSLDDDMPISLEEMTK